MKVITLLIVSMLLMGCNADLNMPLQFRPNHRDPGGYPARVYDPSVTVFIEPVEDARGEGPIVGSMRFERQVHYVRATSSSPEEFVGKAVKRELASAGFNPQPDRVNAGRRLGIRLKKFYTKSEKEYTGEVIADFWVTDSAGKELWRGTISGHSSTWGLARSSENFNECLSDATLDMIGGLISSDGFRTSMGAE